MQWATLAAVALLAQGTTAQFNMLRFACSQLLVERTDPIVNPAQLYTPHLHQIVGGNAFNVTMDPNNDPAQLSTCTSCSFKEDMSNYWTAVMFFKNKNGSYKRVPQTGNGGPQGKLINNGGLDIYYIPSGRVTAFKKGFRMIAGNAANTDASKVSLPNICHRCWNSPNENTFVGGAPCTGTDTVEIPSSQTCKMIRQTIIFPGCWDGKNLDSVDHQSHVKYGQGTGASGGGACPASHPVKLPQVMYELMWNVTDFANDKNIWPSGNPYVYSMNLGGPAAHGDYLFGWKDNTLQLAMDNKCNLNANCPAAGLNAQQPAVYNACTKKQQAKEEVDGWIAELPLGNPAIKA
jgi:hypothetical protein